MKILQIANYTQGKGGISVQVGLLHKKLCEEGFSCDIISTKGTPIQRIRAVWRLLTKGRDYDVFHVHACSDRGFFPAVVGISVGRLLKKRIVLTYHGGGAESFFKKKTKLVRHYLTRTSANIALSGFIGNVFKEYDLPYVIIPNIIELDGGLFRKREVINPNFICTRSLVETYNIECTLKAFQIVQKEYPEATLTILGDGPLRESLENFVKGNGLQNVHFTGLVKNTEIYDYLDKADIMVSSSRADNMPVSILEGFNAGLLIIASRVGGVPYMIEDGKNGLLFTSDDAAEMAGTMIYAIRNQGNSIQMIENAHQSLTEYTWQKSRDRLINIYKNCNVTL